MSEVKKRKIYSSQSSVNIDYHIIEEVNKVVELLDKEPEDTKEQDKESYKTKESLALESFIERGYLAKLLPIWSYYSSTNNHKEFVDITNKINAIIFRINKAKTSASSSSSSSPLSQHRQAILDTFKDILINHIRILYRALSSLKPSSTNPNIRLLDNIVQYDPIIAMEFLNQFDMALPVLPKLVTPSKIEIESGEISNDAYSIRCNFIKFWINLCSQVSHVHRLDLLTNHPKIMRNIWKYLQYDSLQSIHHLINFLDSKVLDEANFKKSQKCKILNDNFMYKVQALFSKVSEPFLINFMNKLTTDTKHGIIFANDSFWNKDSNVGVEIEINNKKFKVANKLLYTLLTSLKPTESNQQLQFIVRVLSSNQELVAPYMNYLVQHGGGYHDPSLTSWWIAHTLLYTNILQIAPPKFNQNTEYINFDAKLMAESIALAPLSKAALTKGLQSSNKKLVLQLTLQLILYILQKLESILQESFISVANTERQELIALVFNQLPDTSAIVQVISASTTNEKDLPPAIPDITKLTTLKILQKYDLYTPSSTKKSSLQKLVSMGVASIVDKNVQSQSLTSYDLIILDMFINLQDQNFKWWNKINNQNSFYTSLIKFASNSSINSSKFSFTKIYTLLNRLGADKMFFNANLLVTPIVALIYSIDSDIADNIEYWNMLDETIARCVRTPYKYFDLTHAKYEDTSIFVVALMEQFKYYINKPNVARDDALKWLSRFIRYLVIFGESKSALVSMITNEMDGIIMDYETILQNHLAFDGDKDFDVRDCSILEIVYNMSLDQLINKLSILEKKVITSNLDFAAILSLLQTINSNPTLESAQPLIKIIFSKIWNFLMNCDEQAIKYFTSGAIWKPLFRSEVENGNGNGSKVIGINTNTNTKLSLQFYNDVLEELPRKVLPEDLLNYIEEGIFPKQKISMLSFAWALDDDQLKRLLDVSSDPVFITSLAAQIIKRGNMVFTVDQFWKIYDIHADKRLEMLTAIINDSLVGFNDIQLHSLLTKIISNHTSDKPLLPLLIRKFKSRSSLYLAPSASSESDSNSLASKLASLTLPTNDDLKLLIVSSLIQAELEVPSLLMSEANELITTKLNSDTNQNDTSSVWNDILVILAAQKNVDSDTLLQVFKVIDYKQTLNSSFIRLVSRSPQSLSTSSGIKLTQWLHKTMLYITKKFAESDTLSENFTNFLNSMGDYHISHSKIWSIAPANVLNTQLEVILQSKFAKNAINLQYVAKMILTAPKNKINFQRLFQISLTALSVLDDLPSSENADARFYAAIIIFILFNFDHSKLSNLASVDNILVKYQGLNRAEDLLLKQVLQKMEAKLAITWIAKVATWELSEELAENEKELVTSGGQEKLIVSRNGQFTITLNKTTILNTFSSCQMGLPMFAKPNGSRLAPEEIWSQMKTLEQQNSLNSSQERLAYDAEFLLMVVLNNEELLQYKKEEDGSVSYNFNIKNMIDNGFLQFIIANLPNEAYQGISKVILNKILVSINSEVNNQFKDKNVYKVFISSILFTLAHQQQQQQPSESGDGKPPPKIGKLVWFIYSQFVPILSNPGHFLYEKVYRYVLSHPKLKSWEVPLWSSIIYPSESSEWYYRELTWVIEQISEGVSTVADLAVLKSSQIEAILNLVNSEYINMKLKTSILKFIYKIQSIDQGSDLLITRFGILTFLELFIQTLNQKENKEEASNKIFTQQLKNNVDSILCRFEVSVGESKRVQEWTSHTLTKELQRLHNALSS